MIGRINIKIPFRRSIFGVSFYRTKEAGFSFTNQATLILSQNLKIDINVLPKWVDENRVLYLTEMLWAAYICNCQETFSKPKFSKSQIIDGFSKLEETGQKEIIKVWNDSLTMGAKPIPGAKKKPQTNR